MYYIFSDDELKFWSAADGWTDLLHATDYTPEDRMQLYMPAKGGYWVIAREAEDLERFFAKARKR